MGRILLILWREVIIVTLLSAWWLAHTYYYAPKIDNLTLKLELEKRDSEQCKIALDRQSDKILKESEETRKLVEYYFGEFDASLNEFLERERDQIKDIEDVEIPDVGEECNGLNDYLMDMIEKLKWNGADVR